MDDKALTDEDRTLQQAFLSLTSFEEYMQNYFDFRNLKSSPAVFVHEMKLLETDQNHTHREKDALRTKRKNAIIKELRKELDTICLEVKEKGYWITDSIPTYDTITLHYHYPDGKRSAINHYLASTKAFSHGQENNLYHATFVREQFFEIALILFEIRSFQKKNEKSESFYKMNRDGYDFLEKTLRICRMDQIISDLRCYCDDFLSLRNMKHLAAKEIFTAFNKELSTKRNAIWQELLIHEKASGKWTTEEKAFRIVHDFYADAIFQYKPDWLHGQSLDIYIPDKKTAIEYQGLQHYSPVDFFGGKEALEDTKKRDQQKRIRCKMNNTKLIYWDFSEPVTKEWFAYFIKPLIDDMPPHTRDFSRE